MSATPWIVGGAVVVAGGFAFWLYHREQTAAAAKAAAAAGAAAASPAGGGFTSKINSIIGAVGNTGGRVTATLLGVPVAGTVFGSAGRQILGGEAAGLEQAAGGLKSIATGHVVAGATSIVKGGVNTALAATGVKQIESLAAKPVHAITGALSKLF